MDGDSALCGAIETLDQVPWTVGWRSQPLVPQTLPDFTKAGWACEHPRGFSCLCGADRLRAEGKANERGSCNTRLIGAQSAFQSQPL